MPHHLERAPEPLDEPWTDEGGFDDDAENDDGDAGFEDDLDAPLVRPTWWRWVAIAVILAMVVAGPVAFALSRVLT